MAALLASSLPCSLKVTGRNAGGDLRPENGKRTSNDQEFSSSRWLAPTKALQFQRPGNRQSVRKFKSNSICAAIGKDEPEDTDGESSSDVWFINLLPPGQTFSVHKPDLIFTKDVLTVVRVLVNSVR